MMKSHNHLVKHALAAGHSVSVFDGEEWAEKRCTQYQKVMDAIQSVDEAQIRIRDAQGKIVGWALIVNDCSFEPDEFVADYTMTDFMNEWQAAYDQLAA